MAAATPAQEATRLIALRLLREGYATPAEIATALGVTPQHLNYWINAAGIDWRAARASRIARRVARAKANIGPSRVV